MNKSRMTPRQKSELRWGWAFMFPTVLGLLVLNIYPTFRTIYQSFFKTGDFGKGNKFVGFGNYIKLFQGTEIWQAIINTFKYAVVEVPFSIAIALVLAVFLNGKIKGRGIYRTVFFLPMVAAPAAVAMVWRWLYNSEFGLINNIFHLKVNWISDPNLAVYSIAIIGIWSIIGYNMILFISGLQEIPSDYYIGGFMVFDIIYMVMDRDNPALTKTRSLVFLFYQYAFRNQDKGMGAAVVVILLLIIIIITALQMLAQKKWVHYN